MKSFAEIGRLLGVSDQQVGNIYRRGMAKLRTNMMCVADIEEELAEGKYLAEYASLVRAARDLGAALDQKAVRSTELRARTKVRMAYINLVKSRNKPEGAGQ